MKAGRKSPLGSGLPRRLVHPMAGKGMTAYFENGARDWRVHLALCSVTRLRILSHLCTHGPLETPALAQALGMRRNRAYFNLHGMHEAALVTRAESPTPPRCGFGWQWSASDEGKTYLWRYGWVTRRLVCNKWLDLPFGETFPPTEALLQKAQPMLLRPLQLTIANLLRWHGPMSVPRMADLIWCRPSLVDPHVQRWAGLGWLESVAGGPRQRNGALRAARWQFTAAGKEALEWHCHALWWAGRHSGFVPKADDPWLNNRESERHLVEVVY